MIGNETYEIRTFTRNERKELLLSASTLANGKLNDVVKVFKPYIYKALNLAQLATQAKEAGYIKSYYDVIDYLFEPLEIFEVISFIMQINKLAENDLVSETIEDLKK